MRELGRHGAEVVPLVRGGSGGGITWDPRAGRFDAARAEGFDAVAHLAGENIASRRWTAARKREIYDSRVVGTRVLAEGLSSLQRPPKVLVAASAVGFYGNSGEAERSEGSPRGAGFLADLCADWEAACAAASARGIRVVRLRMGLVLAPEGGALAKILPIFRLGLGGRIGDGRQWMSWISIHDLVRILVLSLADDGLVGAVNAVSPQPVRNADLTAALARVLRRPAMLPVPAFALRALLGELADALLLSSTRAVPRVLLERGFRFEHPQIESALRATIG